MTPPDPAITFTFDGRPIQARPGQSIGAALYAAGIRIFSRSFKYHRPRGLLCVAGECPNCLMRVDGKPNVRTCVEPAREGQVVEHQNAWPSLETDVLNVFDKLQRWLPVGFYYKRFHKPAWVWPIFEHAVRHIAGLGRVDVGDVAVPECSVENLHAEVCVVGAGPAGLAAARAAAEAGAQVLVLERWPRVGGHLLEAGSDPIRLSRLEIRTGTTVFGLYEGNLLGAFQGDRFLRVRAKRVIVCTGGRERPLLFRNNDLPGVMLAGAVLRLGRWYGVRAGRRAVIVSDRPDGGRVAEQVAELGIEVAAVVDLRHALIFSEKPRPWPTYSSHVVLEAHGRSHLDAVTIAEAGEDGTVLENSHKRIDCDLLCLAASLVPADELFRQSGNVGDEGDVVTAGAASGTIGLVDQVLEGRLRGLEAAAALGYPVSEGEPGPVRAGRTDRVSAPAPPPGPNGNGLAFPTGLAPDSKRFVCLCEDVTDKDLVQAIAEGFDHLETLKRYSTATMGPCQGKLCHQTMIEVCSRATGSDPATVGRTTSRPPATPVELCVLAAGRRHPVRRTPLHHWHEEAGARWMDAGLWKRPESYGDPAAEVRAVRGSVGLIDVSTLGKIEVAGPDAAELLERIYLNRWSDLKPGRVRYGAMCTEEGILFDDGVGARLGPDRFYLTATTGNAEAVVQWLELWQAEWGLHSYIDNRTAAVAAMNLAGPRAREVLYRLTTLDVSNDAFPYLAYREAAVAGVSCRLLRIGFVGELGYEIHCPSAAAQHVWEALLGAGIPFGIRTFGVEAQRVLRLEKGHLIIGQDTDALSNPLEAGLDWLVRFDKPFFHGREPLTRLKDMGPRSRLVGFALKDHAPVPAEGCQVVEHGRPVGRVTSVRVSPTLRRTIGLAWVPAARSSPGDTFAVRWNGGDVTAEVVPLPFYDPAGKRLKS